MRAVLVLALLSGTAAAESWEVRVPEHVQIPLGTAPPISIELAVDRGTSVSKDAAVIIDLALPKGASVKKARLARTDAVDPEADAPRFAVPVRGDALGTYSLEVRLRFWACAAKTCRPVDARRVVEVNVVPEEYPGK
jgi:hypothetical protein